MTLPFESGSVTFRRFTPAGAAPREFGDDHLTRLREFARPAAPRAGAEVTGWGAGGHPTDTTFDHLKQVYPDHLLWEMFRETDRLPHDRLKVYYETDLAALVAGSEKGVPSAKMRREARTSARDRLEGEARDGRWKKWSGTPCLWGLRRNEVFLGSASAALAERFFVLFQATFGGTIAQPEMAGDLTPTTAGSLAVAARPAAAEEWLTCFTSAAPASHPQTPAWHAGGPPDWLGAEFLVWLWHLSEQTDEVKGADGRVTTFMFSGGVRFECPLGQTGDTTANHASGVRTPEARAALRSGKLPRKAALTFVRGGDQFTLKLQPERMEVTGAKLPKGNPDLTPRDRHVARLEHVENLWSAVEAVYGAFLAVRLDPAAWEKEAEDIRTWANRSRRRAA